MENSSSIAKLFNSIAHRYDFLNHLLSLGIDVYWRKKALRGVTISADTHVLDVACGTADLSITAYKQGSRSIEGVDISQKMLEVGREKLQKKGLSDCIRLQQVDGVTLPFETDIFDVVTVGFGVRNFQQRKESLTEMYRVMKPGGYLVILEFSQPRVFPLKQLYKFYFKCILPLVGGLFSGDKGAYDYLPNSVYAFPACEQFENELREIGWRDVKRMGLTGSIASVYYGTK